MEYSGLSESVCLCIHFGMSCSISLIYYKTNRLINHCLGKMWACHDDGYINLVNWCAKIALCSILGPTWFNHTIEICCQSEFESTWFDWEMNSYIHFVTLWGFFKNHTMGAYKLMVGDFASLAMERNFELRLESFRSHCHPPPGVTMLLMSGCQLLSLNGSPDKFIIRFSGGITVSLLIFNYLSFIWRV